VGDPNVPSGEVATVEHAAPLLALGTVIVPVKPLGTVLTPGDAANGKPFGPTDSPGTIPNEEVAPSEGMAVVIPAWAKAALWHNKDQPPQNANTAAQAMTFFFMMTLCSTLCVKCSESACDGAPRNSNANDRCFHAAAIGRNVSINKWPNAQTVQLNMGLSDLTPDLTA
jgi:hypothetical protein